MLIWISGPAIFTTPSLITRIIKSAVELIEKKLEEVQENQNSSLKTQKNDPENVNFFSNFFFYIF